MVVCFSLPVPVAAAVSFHSLLGLNVDLWALHEGGVVCAQVKANSLLSRGLVFNCMSTTKHRLVCSCGEIKDPKSPHWGLYFRQVGSIWHLLKVKFVSELCTCTAVESTASALLLYFVVACVTELHGGGSSRWSAVLSPYHQPSCKLCTRVTCSAFLPFLSRTVYGSQPGPVFSLRRAKHFLPTASLRRQSELLNLAVGRSPAERGRRGRRKRRKSRNEPLPL